MNEDKIIAEAIAGEYVEENHSALYELQKLDRKVKLPVGIFTYSFGVFSTIMFGIGVCLCMNVFGGNAHVSLIAGIVTGFIGFGLMGLNYLLYNRLLEKRRRKYSSQILELAEKVS